MRHRDGHWLLDTGQEVVEGGEDGKLVAHHWAMLTDDHDAARGRGAAAVRAPPLADEKERLRVTLI